MRDASSVRERRLHCVFCLNRNRQGLRRPPPNGWRYKTPRLTVLLPAAATQLLWAGVCAQNATNLGVSLRL